MNKKHFYAAVILLSFLAAGIQPALATKCIPSDTSIGTWDPDGRVYTLTTNVNETIQVDEDNLTLDGAEHTVTVVANTGVCLSDKQYVTITNLNVTGCGCGISLSDYSSNNTLTGNIASDNIIGILLSHSSYNTVTGNTTLNCTEGIRLYLSGSTNNTITNNTTLNNKYGIHLYTSSGNTLTGNTLTGDGSDQFDEIGIWLEADSSSNTLTNNTASDNLMGIYLNNSSNNTVYHNNLIDNTTQAKVLGSSGNVFNLDLPIGGNFWNDWSGSGPYVFNGGQDDSPWTDPNGWLLPVPDTTPPDMTPPGNTTVEAMGPDGVPVDDERIQTFLASASAIDNCDPNEDIIITNNAPTLFPPEDTIVTFTATDTSGNSSTCQSTVTVVEAAERHLRIIPSIINREGRLEKILAVIRFPEGTTEEDIDMGQPLILYPGDSPDGIEAINQRIVTWYWFGTLRVSVFASFSKNEVTAGVPENGPAEMMVIGRFTSGQYFYGFDNVWIISWDW